MLSKIILASKSKIRKEILDRNHIKNPDSDDFSIELPQEYYNVESVKLASAYFPIVDNQFSITQNNVDLCFRFTKAFNPLDMSGVTIQNALSFLFISENIFPLIVNLSIINSA